MKKMRIELRKGFKSVKEDPAGFSWTDEQVARYHGEMEAIAADCFQQVPRYQCLSGDRKELERNIITIARDSQGRPVGFCSAVVLKIDGYKNILHLGLTCVNKEARMMSFFSAVLLRLMGVTIIPDKNPDRLKSNYLIVANHLSYIDILILSGLFPCCFVTSMEIRQTPFLGHIMVSVQSLKPRQ